MSERVRERVSVASLLLCHFIVTFFPAGGDCGHPAPRTRHSVRLFSSRLPNGMQVLRCKSFNSFATVGPLTLCAPFLCSFRLVPWASLAT